MDSKNVILAVVLSTVVLIFWATFFEPPIVEQEVNKNQTTQEENNTSPSIEKTTVTNKTSRIDALNVTKRIKIENNNIKGTISLRGALIDDITFKNYKEKLEENKKVIFLNPKNSTEGYYIETGWASDGSSKINLPLDTTVWSVRGNNVLSPSNPVTLEWKNDQGLILRGKIWVKDNFWDPVTPPSSPR